MSNLVWIGRTSIWVRRPALKNRGRCLIIFSKQLGKYVIMENKASEEAHYSSSLTFCQENLSRWNIRY